MKFVPLAVIVAVLVVGTLLEGKFSDRWGKAQSARLDAYTVNLNKVPRNFGHWIGVDDEVTEQKQKEFEASNCSGCISRTYRNRDGQVVNVYLVTGSARHVTIHTPDWCYVGAGYDIIGGEPQQYTDAESGMDPPPEYLAAFFQKETPIDTNRICIFWAFSDDGIWRGPRMPKPTYAGKSALYKIYMITDLDSVGQEVSKNPSIDFAREFLPILNNVLFDVPETAES